MEKNYFRPTIFSWVVLVKMDKILDNLRCFSSSRKKVHLICSCEDEIIHSLSQLIFNLLHQKIKIKNIKKTKQLLSPIRHSLRKLSDKRVSIRNKRKILVQVGIRTILFPIIRNNLLPSLVKSLKQ